MQKPTRLSRAQRWGLSGCALVLLLALTVRTAAALPCPSVTITVDNDIKGSGYSEVNAQNWVSNSPGACHINYRYLSHTVGDKTRKGKAIWQPKITVTGMWDFTVSYRATSNRTTDADYYVYDDNGGTKHIVINQKHSGDCTKMSLGSFYCKVGGSCRVVLDGTDDSQSDSADMATFKLVKCTGTPPANPCSGISANKNYELCAWTATTCAGNYLNGAGCKTYCAAAGMVCTARFGGDKGCKKEPQNPISCNASNGHLSDWCECAYPPGKDAGPPPLKDSAVPAKDSAPPLKDSASPAKDSALPAKDSATSDGANTGDAPLLQDSAASTGDGVDPYVVGRGCGCAYPGENPSTAALLFLLLGLLWHFGRKRQV